MRFWSRSEHGAIAVIVAVQNMCYYEVRPEKTVLCHWQGGVISCLSILRRCKLRFSEMVFTNGDLVPRQPLPTDFPMVCPCRAVE